MTTDLKKIKFTTNIEEIVGIARDIGKNKNVKAIFLFGSQVFKKIHPLSDIDLCIITNNDENVDYPDTDNLDVSFFHNLPISIKFKVLNEGKPLVIKDKEFLNEIKIRTIREYLEFKHILNRYIWENFKCTI